METLCKIRDLHRAIIAFENDLQALLNLSLNEGMALCTLKNVECLSSGQLAEQLSLRHSNTSKLIKILEDKELIARCIGTEDKRQMLFSITQKGKDIINEVQNIKIPLSEILAYSIEDSNRSNT